MFFGTRNVAGQMGEVDERADVAVNVLTMEPVSYQVKGTLDGGVPGPFGTIRRFRVDQVYSASPPLAGEAIEMK